MRDERQNPGSPRESGYSFGDSEIAAERLAVVAEVFGPTSRVLLQSSGAQPRRVLDLGPGPGHTTALLAALYPGAAMVAIELSDSFAAQARARVPNAAVIVGDVTAPLPGEFDLIYARFLLSHLPEVDATVAAWCRVVAPSGALVLEEPESIVASDPLFARYEEIVAAVVAARGADMYAGALLAGGTTPAGFRRSIDRSIDPRVTAGAAAEMFWRNARAWDSSVESLLSRGELDGLVTQLKARVGDPALDAIRWSLRQVVLTRSAV